MRGAHVGIAILALCASIARPASAEPPRVIDPAGSAVLAGPAAGIARARPLVVIDPGHGGSNTGAAGAVAGVHEKQVTLAIATRVRELLAARGVDVVLTRDDDRTLTLRQRAAIADHLGADAFI